MFSGTSKGIALVLRPALVACLVAGAGCGPETKEQPITAQRAALSSALNTRIAGSIEIDSSGNADFGDANLFTGPDPADSSPSYQKPTGGPTPFVDWNDLGSDKADHLALDCPADPKQCAGGKDTSAFPRSDECVGTASVLSKMDLTYVAIASNPSYAYYGVQRSGNSGDAAYYWLFTINPPIHNTSPSGNPCKLGSGEYQLEYSITPVDPATGVGDVMLVGHFTGSGTIPFRVFRAAQKKVVTGIQAVDFTSGLWTEVTGSGIVGAINTTNTAPGAFGATGVVSLSGGNLGPGIFAEAAIPMGIFSTNPACGASFYGSVITRSSGSGGTTPDLKDYEEISGVVDLGKIVPNGTLTPKCDGSIDYAASATLEGQPVTGITCAWTFTGQGGTPLGTSSSCSGNLPAAAVAAAGQVTGSVTITTAAGCIQSATASAVAPVTQPLSVTATLTPSCQSSFGYNAAVSGGTGKGLSYTWTFTGPGTATPVAPASLSTQSGTAQVSAPGTYTGQVMVQDTGNGCQATSTPATARALTPLGVTISAAAPAACTMGEAATIQAAPSGGDGNYSYQWTPSTCAGATCTYDPGASVLCVTQPIQVQLSDGSGLCPAASSNMLTYSKVTTVTIN